MKQILGFYISYKPVHFKLSSHFVRLSRKSREPAKPSNKEKCKHSEVEAIKLKKRFYYLKKVPENYLDICSAVPMGFSLSKSATQVSAMRIDSKVDDHLMQGTEESRLEPVTQLFQNTKKIRLEDPHKENFKRSEETGTGTLSAKALGSVVYVKESDGIEMTDVE